MKYTIKIDALHRSASTIANELLQQVTQVLKRDIQKYSVKRAEELCGRIIAHINTDYANCITEFVIELPDDTEPLK